MQLLITQDDLWPAGESSRSCFVAEPKSSAAGEDLFRRFYWGLPYTLHQMPRHQRLEHVVECVKDMSSGTESQQNKGLPMDSASQKLDGYRFMAFHGIAWLCMISCLTWLLICLAVRMRSNCNISFMFIYGIPMWHMCRSKHSNIYQSTGSKCCSFMYLPVLPSDHVVAQWWTAEELPAIQDADVAAPAAPARKPRTLWVEDLMI